MRLTADHDVLAAALTAAAAVKSSGVGIQLVLAGDQLTVTGTNLDQSVRTIVTVEADGDATIVVHDKIADLVRSLESGPVTLAAEAEQIRITQGASSYSLPTFDQDSFPRVRFEPRTDIKAPAEEFFECLDRVLHAASSDLGRPVLCGVLVSGDGGLGRLVATDSYRLAVAELADVAWAGDDVIVPASAFELLAKHRRGGDLVEIGIESQAVTLRIGPVWISSALVDGNYPAWGALVPQRTKSVSVTVDRHGFADRLKRLVSIMGADTIKLAIDANGAVIVSGLEASDGKSLGMEQLDSISHEGGAALTAFTGKYLLDAVNAYRHDVIRLDLDPRNAKTKPALVESDDVAGVVLLMPVAAES